MNGSMMLLLSYAQTKSEIIVLTYSQVQYPHTQVHHQLANVHPQLASLQTLARIVY